MTIALTFVIILTSTFTIFQIRKLAERLKMILNKDLWVDRTLKFQAALLLLALLVLGLVRWINPQNFAMFFRLGDLQTHISRIGWLGIAGTETWLEIATGVGFFISLGTGIFMFFQVKKAGFKFQTLLSALPWVILFSAINAFSEEAIFRMGIVSPLFGLLSTPTIVLMSAVMFGLPHYFGQPSGVIGALMAGFLGWLLALSLVETHGMLLAWVIHFVQDVIILASVYMINQTKKELFNG